MRKFFLNTYTKIFCLLWLIVGSYVPLNAQNVLVKSKNNFFRQKHNLVAIEKVMVTEKTIDLYMKCSNTMSSQRIDPLNMEEKEYMNVGIPMHLKINDKKGKFYNLVEVHGIPIIPNYEQLGPGQILKFRLSFEHLDPDQDSFDLIECDKNTNKNCWQFSDIKLKIN